MGSFLPCLIRSAAFSPCIAKSLYRVGRYWPLHREAGTVHDERVAVGCDQRPSELRGQQFRGMSVVPACLPLSELARIAFAHAEDECVHYAVVSSNH